MLNRIQIVLALLSFLLCLSTILSQSSSSKGQITDQLDNGCNLTRKMANSTRRKPDAWWEYMPLPHLNCSGTGQTRLDVTGVVEDTKSISLSYNDLIEFHIDDLAKFKKLSKLVIKSNQLKRIVASDTGLMLPLVTSLTLTQNKLESIPNDALRSFPNLTTLVINNNQISSIRDDDFRFNPNLTIVSLGVNPIQTFESAWMSKLKLTGLNLRDCGLRRVPSPVASLSGLLYADLSENMITSLPANSFANTSRLYWLDLAANKITTMDERAFKGANKLTVIDLSDNLLQNIPANTFEGMTQENLQVDLYENPLLCDCTMASFRQWSDQMKLRDASTEIRYSCGNPLRNHGKKSHQLTIDDYTCEANDVMWTADCGTPVTATIPPPTGSEPVRTCPAKCNCYDSNQQIYYPEPGQPPNKKYSLWVYWRSFKYPKVECVDTKFVSIPQETPDDAQSLIMYGNRFTTFNIRDLSRFKSLKYLFLKGNSIARITADPDTVLPSLTHLRLSYNNISSIDKSHLKSFPNLQVFSIYHNKLKTIPNDLFAYNSMIKSLYLGPNPVKTFDEDFMKTLSLKRMSLRNLSLSTVPKSLRNLDQLMYLDLSDNNIQVVKNSSFSKCTTLYRLSMDNNKIKTIEVNAFSGATALISLDLTENLIQTLPAKVFSNISQERLTVELWENPFLCDCKMKPFKSWVEERESNDPMTEIRFVCDQPTRMHRHKSDQLTSNDFVCSNDDTNFTEDTCIPQPIGGKIALAVVLTFICTALLGFVLWKCTFKRRYGNLLNYAKQRQNYDDDMEELQ